MQTAQSRMWTWVTVTTSYDNNGNDAKTWGLSNFDSHECFFCKTNTSFIMRQCLYWSNNVAYWPLKEPLAEDLSNRMHLSKQVEADAWADSQMDEPETSRHCAIINAVTHCGYSPFHSWTHSVKRSGGHQQEAGKLPKWSSGPFPDKETKVLCKTLNMEAQHG